MPPPRLTSRDPRTWPPVHSESINTKPLPCLPVYPLHAIFTGIAPGGIPGADVQRSTGDLEPMTPPQAPKPTTSSSAVGPACEVYFGPVTTHVPAGQRMGMGMMSTSVERETMPPKGSHAQPTTAAGGIESFPKYGVCCAHWLSFFFSVPVLIGRVGVWQHARFLCVSPLLIVIHGCGCGDWEIRVKVPIRKRTG